MISNLTIALVLLPIVGAAIAWAGDVIGSALGRSRRSAFGLRPRSTARLVAVVVGAVLPLAGLAFAMAISEEARVAVLHLDELRQEAGRLSADNRRLETSVARARRQATEADTKARAAEQRLQSTEEVLLTSREVLRDTQAALDSNRLKLSGVQGELQGTRGRLGQTRGELGQAHSSLSAARGDLTAARADLASARIDLTQAKENLQATRAGLETTQKSLQASNRSLESVTAELKQLDTLERKVAGAQEYLSEADERLAAKQQQLEETERRLAWTEQLVEDYKIAFSAIIEQPIALEAGEEVIRAFVDSGLSRDQIEAALQGLLRLAGRAAAAHGIGPGRGDASVVVVSPLPPERGPGRVDEQDIVSEVARQIHAGGAPTYVVIIRAWSRAYERQPQPAAVEFWVAPNKTVFRAGEVILSTVIDGGLPRPRVFQALLETTRSIRRVAAARGMLSAPETGEYGKVPAEDLLDAMDQILAIGGPARIRFVVVVDARVAQPRDEPMVVSVEVSRASGP